MSVRITRIKNRSYVDGYYVDEGTGERCDVKRVKSHAEYAVVKGQQVFARLMRSNDQWVAIERQDETKFGMVVSPMNVRSWRALRAWALKKWGGGGKTKCEDQVSKSYNKELTNSTPTFQWEAEWYCLKTAA